MMINESKTSHSSTGNIVAYDFSARRVNPFTMNATIEKLKMKIETSTVCMTPEELAVIVLAGLESLPAEKIGDVKMGEVQDCTLEASDNGILLTVHYEKLEEEDGTSDNGE